MKAKILLRPAVEKDYRKLPKQIQSRFYKALDTITENPLIGIPLHGIYQGSRKFRIGEYRIVYQFFSKEKTIVVYRIEPRQGAYKH